MENYNFGCKRACEQHKTIKLVDWERESLDIIYQVAEIIFDKRFISETKKYTKGCYLIFRPLKANGDYPTTPLFGIDSDRSLKTDDEERVQFKFPSANKSLLKLYLKRVSVQNLIRSFVALIVIK